MVLAMLSYSLPTKLGANGYLNSKGLVYYYTNPDLGNQNP